MKAPFFVWQSGLLDAFDTIGEIEDCYSADDISGDDCTLYDSAGKALAVSAQSDGTARISCDEHQPSQCDALMSLLRGYLERGGMSAERSSSLTLHELIQAVYPYKERAGRRTSRGDGVKPERSPIQHAHPDPAFARLVDAFGVALAVGAVAACIAIVCMLVYFGSVGSRPGGAGFAALGIFMGDSLWAGILGGLIGGISVFWRRLDRFDLFNVLPGKSIARAFFALIPILVAVGALVSVIVFAVLLLWGEP